MKGGQLGVSAVFDLQDLLLPLLLHIPARDSARLSCVSLQLRRLAKRGNETASVLSTLWGFPLCRSLRELAACEAGRDWLLPIKLAQDHHVGLRYFTDLVSNILSVLIVPC
eukprot:gnl/TRDRNA2_/TRDRNA2_166670_c1_seq1.p1 gnl/TRDRNA2_/TRDRNA2_166670_c1~~gnl/TRDRNA2_/TRDRNA2_166670_c1_seq1.p1  ORF type:complete len:111 (-),score=5.05 gnl/TRDRNA2_/TRDRNA2_166670_c1_seq1:62-394(-)